MKHESFIFDYCTNVDQWLEHTECAHWSHNYKFPEDRVIFILVDSISPSTQDTMRMKHDINSSQLGI